MEEIEEKLKSLDKDAPSEEVIKQAFETLENDVLKIINSRECFLPLVYERYDEVCCKINQININSVFNKMKTLDPEYEKDETDAFKEGLMKLRRHIDEDWEVIKDSFFKVFGKDVKNPEERHKQLISTEVAIGTIISHKSDMMSAGYSEAECDFLHKLGMVILRLNKLEYTLHRVGRIGRPTGYIEPDVSTKKFFDSSNAKTNKV